MHAPTESDRARLVTHARELAAAARALRSSGADRRQVAEAIAEGAGLEYGRLPAIVRVLIERGGAYS